MVAKNTSEKNVALTIKFREVYTKSLLVFGVDKLRLNIAQIFSRQRFPNICIHSFRSKFLGSI